ncbi:MAG: hypothetical protein AAGA88_12010 [Pseudomonadota bacterium]
MTKETEIEIDALSDEAPIGPVLDAYRDAYNDYDANALAACFLFPVTLWQFGKGFVFENAEDLAENIEKVLDAYEEAGVVETHYEVADWVESGSAASAVIDWDQSDADGETVHVFSCLTVFAEDDRGEMKITTIVNL